MRSEYMLLIQRLREKVLRAASYVWTYQKSSFQATNHMAVSDDTFFNILCRICRRRLAPMIFCRSCTNGKVFGKYLGGVFYWDCIWCLSCVLGMFWRGFVIMAWAAPSSVSQWSRYWGRLALGVCKWLNKGLVRARIFSHYVRCHIGVTWRTWNIARKKSTHCSTGLNKERHKSSEHWSNLSDGQVELATIHNGWDQNEAAIHLSLAQECKALQIIVSRPLSKRQDGKLGQIPAR